MRRRSQFTVTFLFAGLLTPLCAQDRTPWRDPSPHTVKSVTTDEGVRLEVLDWGGSGRPLVLLAGGGNTAHVFDDFAPKLAANFHIYGVTRRGFGASSFVALEGGATRLGQDVLAVIDALKLDRPVLVGHSFGGAELSAVANFRPDRIAGLVYLEAGYTYAFDNGKGMKMEELMVLQARQPQPPAAGPSDLVSFGALQEWQGRRDGYRIPEAELRQTWESTGNGRPEKPRFFLGFSVFTPVLTAATRYTGIPVPALAVFTIPHVPETWMTESSDPAVRSAVEANQEFDALADKQAKAFEAGVPTAHVVRLRGRHYVFMSNEREVLDEIRAFVAGLQ